MHSDIRLSSLWAVLFLFVSLSQAFYIPGWSIKSYTDGEAIPLFVNKVYSDNTQLQYAYNELPFVCHSIGRVKSHILSNAHMTLNLGEVLRGDRISLSDYELTMGNDDEAHYLCSVKVDSKGLRWAQDLVAEGYVAEWIVDNLPGATTFVTADRRRKWYAAGFKMGYTDVMEGGGIPRYYINNHVVIVVRWHKAPGSDGDKGKKVIVGFEVYAKSVSAEGRNSTTGLPEEDINGKHKPMELRMPSNRTVDPEMYRNSSYVPAEFDGEDEDGKAELTIPYTYSVYYREEHRIEWANRWDMYFSNQEGSSKVHWFAIVNSVVICGLLTACVAVIVTRTIRGDINSYKEGGLEAGKPKIRVKKGTRSPRKSTEKTGGLLEQVDAEENDVSSDEESIEDLTGWKLVHGDVFRAPAYGGLLAPLVGSGTQLVFMAVGLLVLSCFGILNPSFRGGFISSAVGLFVFAGAFSGYYSGRVYRTFGGQLWQKNALVTATLFPGLMFTTIFILNLFVWAQASSTAIPFGTLIGLVALWLLIQLPLVYVGSWFGFVQVGAWDHPLKTNAIPRQIPSQPWYSHSTKAIITAGFFPFAVIAVELLFVFKSLWQDKSGFYYVFGFLAVVSVILVITVIEVTVVAVYLQLCAENHQWHWRSFLLGGSSSLWIFAYCVWYYYSKLHIQGFVSSMLFFSYSALACMVYGLLTGTIGFLASYAFVRRIYGAIKVD